MSGTRNAESFRVHMSLKGKLTLYYGMFMLLLSGTFCAALLWEIDDTLSDFMRQMLVDDVEKCVENIYVDNDEYYIDQKIFFLDDINVMIYDQNGNKIGGEYEGNFSLDFQNQEVRVVDDGEGHSWFLYDYMFHVSEGNNIWIRGVTSTSILGKTRTRMIYEATVLLAIGALTVYVGGYLIAAHTCRPLTQMNQIIKNIFRGKDLSKRVTLNVKQHDEIRDLADAFNEMAERLLQSFEKERRFASDVSHELRTPLSVILSETDWALSVGDQEEQERVLRIVRQKAERMSGLVNILLLISRMENEEVNVPMELLDFRKVMQMAAESVETKAARRHIQIHTEGLGDDSVWLYGNEILLFQMVQNLLTNAVCYGKDFGNIWISLWTETQEERVEICGAVRDDGIGIAPENLQKVFDRFFRVDAVRNQDKDGYGLGLCMAYRICRRHSGELTVQSELGQGSEFVFRLPAQEVVS